MRHYSRRPKQVPPGMKTGIGVGRGFHRGRLLDPPMIMVRGARHCKGMLKYIYLGYSGHSLIKYNVGSKSFKCNHLNIKIVQDIRFYSRSRYNISLA